MPGVKIFLKEMMMSKKNIKNNWNFDLPVVEKVIILKKPKAKNKKIKKV